MPYILTVRKVKLDPVAQAMARKRWKGKTKAEKLATSRHASEARSRKAAERRVALRERENHDANMAISTLVEAQATEPEAVEA